MLDFLDLVKTLCRIQSRLRNLFFFHFCFIAETKANSGQSYSLLKNTYFRDFFISLLFRR